MIRSLSTTPVLTQTQLSPVPIISANQTPLQPRSTSMSPLNSLWSRRSTLSHESSTSMVSSIHSYCDSPEQSPYPHRYDSIFFLLSFLLIPLIYLPSLYYHSHSHTGDRSLLRDAHARSDHIRSIRRSSTTSRVLVRGCAPARSMFNTTLSMKLSRLFCHRI